MREEKPEELAFQLDTPSLVIITLTIFLLGVCDVRTPDFWGDKVKRR